MQHHALHTQLHMFPGGMSKRMQRWYGHALDDLVLVWLQLQCISRQLIATNLNTVTCNVLCTNVTNSSNADCAMQITDIADAENKWTYLEASDQGYHLYIRHGFEVLEELRVTPDAPVMLGMGRPPQ